MWCVVWGMLLCVLCGCVCMPLDKICAFFVGSEMEILIFLIILGLLNGKKRSEDLNQYDVLVG